MQPESRSEVAKREWREPRLHKLAVAATASSMKPNVTTIGNDSGGPGGGKGDVTGLIS
jgi:hypothetical protein